MNRIPLRNCTVHDARWYYLNGKPIIFNSFQTFGGKDENGYKPSIALNGKMDSSFSLDGSLKWESSKDNSSGIIHDWLSQNINGPYYTNNSQSLFYYLGGHHSEYGFYWMQICSNPLNVLSEDCMDEIMVWIPAL